MPLQPKTCSDDKTAVFRRRWLILALFPRLMRGVAQKWLQVSCATTAERWHSATSLVNVAAECGDAAQSCRRAKIYVLVGELYKFLGPNEARRVLMTVWQFISDTPKGKACSRQCSPAPRRRPGAQTRRTRWARRGEVTSMQKRGEILWTRRGRIPSTMQATILLNYAPPAPHQDAPGLLSELVGPRGAPRPPRDVVLPHQRLLHQTNERILGLFWSNCALFRIAVHVDVCDHSFAVVQAAAAMG